MNVLLWHVHGSWTTAFVQGRHRYLLPVTPGRGPEGRGRARTWDWPAAAVEVTPDEARTADIDVVVLQRPEELESWCEEWTGRQPGRDVPAVYLEHNAPQGRINEMRHPIADRDDVPLVHVTHFNELFWDTGRAPTQVIEHGVPEPGATYDGSEAVGAVVVNEPLRRWRVTGTDLLPHLSQAAPLDVFGMGIEGVEALAPGRVRTRGNLPHELLHKEMARCRCYVHPVRWTSLGLSLIEAMMIGMPVVALATTEVVDAVPPDAGVVSTRVDRLTAAIAEFIADPAAGTAAGTAARQAAIKRFGVDRFLRDWDHLLEEVAA